MTWILGDILDRVTAEIDPDHPALIHGNQVTRWGDLDRRSNNIANALLTADIKRGDKIAFYMRNCAEYSETFAACIRAGFTHVNVNYRYRAQELHHIFSDSDAAVIFYATEFRPQIAQLQPQLTKVRLFVEISNSGSCAEFASDYESLAATGDGTPVAGPRSVDDALFIYTGGTTGMPKGVMWRAGEFYAALQEVVRYFAPVPETLDALIQRLRDEGPGPISLPACPLMHGTGFAGMVGNLMSGGTLVTLSAASFNATEAWQTIARHRVQRMSIVGDAFGRPLVNALEADARDFDLSSLEMMSSSGVMWSTEIKRRLLHHLPQLVLLDSFGASEGLGFGTSIMTKDGESQTGRFAINDLAKVFADDESEVVPGSDREGWLAVGGPLPLGYYKDPEKTASVFRTIANKRYSIPGDRCKVAADGSIIFLGRGSVCINTGGEKVFPEEVEEVLKRFGGIQDVLVVGIPDPRWGQAVTAVVESDVPLDEAAAMQHVRDNLADYKVPKRILTGAVALRTANGKADYAAARDFAVSALGSADG